jgi:hypothetical protein
MGERPWGAGASVARGILDGKLVSIRCPGNAL